MLIEHMIQLLQENSIPQIVYILLEWKPLPVIIFYESNGPYSSMTSYRIRVVKGAQ